MLTSSIFFVEVNTMNTLFKFTETCHWFDGQGESVLSFQIFDDGTVEYYDFCDERLPGEIKNKWLIPSKYLQEIKDLISKVYDSYDFNAEDTIKDVEGGFNKEISANIITQSFIIYDVDKNFETKFCFKQGHMTSHFFCRKAPFTLITNQILDLIKRNITYFQLQVE